TRERTSGGTPSSDCSPKDDCILIGPVKLKLKSEAPTFASRPIPPGTTLPSFQFSYKLNNDPTTQTKVMSGNLSQLANEIQQSTKLRTHVASSSAGDSLVIEPPQSLTSDQTKLAYAVGELSVSSGAPTLRLLTFRPQYHVVLSLEAEDQAKLATDKTRIMCRVG